MTSKNEHKPAEKGRIDGRHVTLIFIAFFGIIMAVNFTMARFATTGFSGTVVDNSYVASQKFNGWLDAAEAQAKLGWQPTIIRASDGRILISVKDRQGDAMQFQARGKAQRPIGDKELMALTFHPADPYLLQSGKPLANGRWQLHLTIESAGQHMLIQADFE